MKKVVILFLSFGWVVTLILALFFIVSFIEAEVYPVLYQSKEQLNSFPYIGTVKNLLGISAIWFAGAIIGWSIYLFRKNRL